MESMGRTGKAYNTIICFIPKRQARDCLAANHPGAPMLYMGDEFGQHGGADPDNRRMLDFNLNDGQQDLMNFTSEIANVRLENEALRGVFTHLPCRVRHGCLRDDNL